MLRVIPVELLEALAADYYQPPPPPPPAAPQRSRRRGIKADNRVARCRAYLEKIDPSVEGQHGSDQTFQAARIIWADFGIDEAEGYPLLEEYNASSCTPPWSGRELRHKWDDAVKKGGPRGGKLDDDRPGYEPRTNVRERRAEGRPRPVDVDDADEKPTEDAGGDTRVGDGGDRPPGSPPTDATTARQPRPRRREIQNNNRQLVGVVGDALRAIGENNTPPVVFDRGGVMVRVRNDFVSGNVIEPLNESAVQLQLSHWADWFTEHVMKESTRVEPDAPKMKAVRALMSMPGWGPVPYLAGITSAPMFTADGHLLLTPGYDPTSRYIFRPDPGLEALAVPETPTADEIRAARELLYRPIEEFPFEDEASRTHALVMMIVPFARELIDGPTPLHLFEAPTEGTGKTLLTETICVPAFGRRCDAMQEVGNPDEWRKTLFGDLLSNPQMMFVDNINKKLDSGPFASALTATRMRQRVLGVSRTQSVLIRCVWMGSGNNVIMSREMVRRIVLSRLIPPSETPYLGRNFKRDLPGWAVENRAALVTAGLTLIRAWLAAGKPRGTQKLGMYESYTRVIGGILDVAGIPGFLGNMDHFRKTATSSEEDAKELVRAWWAKHGGHDTKAADLYDLAAELGCLEAIPDKVGANGERDRTKNRGAKTAFADTLFKMRDRVYDRFRLLYVGKHGHTGGRIYRLKELGIEHPTVQTETTSDGDTIEFE